MSYSTGSSANRSLSPRAAADRARRVERRAPAALHGLFFLSGTAALAYEVLWMRGFAIFLGATAPAAAAALAAFFVGFGIGSYLLGRFAPRLRRPLRAFAILEIVTGVSALAVDPLLRAAQPVLAWLSDAQGDNAILQLGVKVAVAIASVLIPAAAMGGTLPVLARLVAPRGESLGVRSGGLYAVNTFGACAGALAMPAVLLPAIGADGALCSAITINVLVAAGAVLLDRLNERVAPEPASPRPSRRVQGSRPSARQAGDGIHGAGQPLPLRDTRSNGEALADGKSAISLMLLEAGRGTASTIEGNGDDETEAVDALVGLVERQFADAGIP